MEDFTEVLSYFLFSEEQERRGEERGGEGRRGDGEWCCRWVDVLCRRGFRGQG